MISLPHSNCLDCCQEQNTYHYTHSILFDVVIETKSCGGTFAKLIAFEFENSDLKSKKIYRKLNNNKVAYFTERNKEVWKKERKVECFKKVFNQKLKSIVGICN